MVLTFVNRAIVKSYLFSPVSVRDFVYGTNMGFFLVLSSLGQNPCTYPNMELHGSIFPHLAIFLGTRYESKEVSLYSASTVLSV